MTKIVTLIKGDGIGPEVIHAAQKIIEATNVKIEWEVCEAGAKIFKKGLATGIPQETIDSLIRTKVALKGPLETPVGYGEKSANVTLRALFETYANIRPIQNLPGIQTPFSKKNIDFVVVRENLEDLYAGIEYLQTPTVAEGLKLITRKGSEQIIRFAFELARAEDRKKVHCATKSNILKLTEGLFKQIFEEIATDYPDIEAQHIIVDNCAHQLVTHPEIFDIIVTTNLQGDILSDLASGLIGGLGVAPSANIGKKAAIFEAVHGSAPKYAGQNTINPTAVLFSAALMLRHLKEFEAAHSIEQSILYTFGIEKAFTRDLDSTNSLSTTDFTDRIIKNLGKETNFWTHRAYTPVEIPTIKEYTSTTIRQIVGIDVFIESTFSSQSLGESLENIALPSPFNLKMLTNRSVQVYPAIPGIHTETTDFWRARFIRKNDHVVLNEDELLELLANISKTHIWMHIEKLYEFNQKPSFTKAQGEI